MNVSLLIVSKNVRIASTSYNWCWVKVLMIMILIIIITGIIIFMEPLVTAAILNDVDDCFLRVC